MLTPDHPEPREAPATYDGPCKLLDWRQGAKDGMTVDLHLGLPGPYGGHPFRGIPTGKENGQRFSLRITMAPFEGQPGGSLVYAGESVLLRWSENDRTGIMVRFLLDDGPDGEVGRHPFFGLAIGRRAGEPLDLVAIGIGEDETPISPSRIRRRTPFHQLTEVQQSAVLGRDPRFRQFLKTSLPHYVKDATARHAILLLENDPDTFATAAIRAALGISSRAIMNGDGAEAHQARARWRRICSDFEDALWGKRRLGRSAGPTEPL